jgi:hypothetical protein
MEVVGQRHAPAALPPGNDPVPIVQETGCAPGPVWMGDENVDPIGIRSPVPPARSESLYRLRYPGPRFQQLYSLYYTGFVLKSYASKYLEL